MQEKSIGIEKIFDFWFLTDLHVLERPEQKTFQNVRLSVCLSVCGTNFVAVLQQKLMAGIS